MGIHIDEECPVCKGQSKACDDEDWDCLNCSDKADQKHNAQMLDGCETDDERDAEMRHQTQGRSTMKLYKKLDAVAGERWQASKTGLKEPNEVTLPSNGRQGMAAFLNANEAEVSGGAVIGTVSLNIEAERPLDDIERAELRAVSAAAPTRTTLPENVQRDWDANQVEDFILHTATQAQVERLFSALGCRFGELARAAR